MESGFNPVKPGKPEISGRLTFEALSRENWDKFVALFGEKGACGNCWCMAYRLKKPEFEAGKCNDGNKHLMKQLVWKNQPTGILGILNGRAVSWCAFAPREVFLRLENSRIHKRIDNKAVWSIPCLFIDKRFRRQGLSVLVLKGITDYARKNNIEIIEAYPVITAKDLPDPFVWSGLFKTFEQAGFLIADRTSGNRPLVRYYTKVSTRYVAFLRGINVGGRKVIRMEELNQMFKSAGFLNVRTLIQSGNVIFDAMTDQIAELTKELENLIRNILGYEVRVFVRSLEEMRAIVQSGPFVEKEGTDRRKYYLSLLASPAAKKSRLPFYSANKDLEVIRLDNDLAYIVSHEVNGKYKFPNNFIEELLCVDATTRNWNTIKKLVKE